MGTPYNFAARSRVAMVAAIESISSPYYDSRERFAFSWNVKLPYCSSANEAKTLDSFHPEGGRFAPALDGAWETEMERDGFDGEIIEDMRCDVEDYSTFDGESVEFSFAGRQGGHLCLESIQGNDLKGFNIDSLLDQRTGWGLERSEYTFKEVRSLYRALVCIEHDFRAEAIRAAMLHAIAWTRMQWEEAQAERLETLLGNAKASKELAGEILAAMRSSVLPAVIMAESRLRVAKLARDSRTQRIEAARIIFADEAAELFGEAA